MKIELRVNTWLSGWKMFLLTCFWIYLKSWFKRKKSFQKALRCIQNIIATSLNFLYMYVYITFSLGNTNYSLTWCLHLLTALSIILVLPNINEHVTLCPAAGRQWTVEVRRDNQLWRIFTSGEHGLFSSSLLRENLLYFYIKSFLALLSQAKLHNCVNVCGFPGFFLKNVCLKLS